MGAKTWLSPNSTNKENKSETTVNPLQKYLEEIKSLPNERWLLASDDQSPLKKSAKCPLEKYSRDISALAWLAPESRSNDEENKSETMVNPLQRYREKMDCFPTKFWLQSTIPTPDHAEEARVPMLHDPNGLVFITGQEKVQIEKEIKSHIRSMQGVTHSLQQSNHGVVVSSEAFKLIILFPGGIPISLGSSPPERNPIILVLHLSTRSCFYPTHFIQISNWSVFPFPHVITVLVSSQWDYCSIVIGLPHQWLLLQWKDELMRLEKTIKNSITEIVSQVKTGNSNFFC